MVDRLAARVQGRGGCFAGTGAEYVVGDTGHIVPHLDTDAAAEAVMQQLDLSVENRINFKARTRYEEEFAPEPFANRLASALHDESRIGAQ